MCVSSREGEENRTFVQGGLEQGITNLRNGTIEEGNSNERDLLTIKSQ